MRWNIPMAAIVLAGSAFLLSACGSDPMEPPPPTNGSIAVTTTTTGSNLDPDGYTASVDGGANQAIGINASITVSSVAAGQHSVQLAGIAANCSVTGANPVSVDVTAGATATAAFAITCSADTGGIDVTTATTGTNIDPDGYTVAVDGGSGQAIAVNGSVSFSGLSVGDHSVELTGVAANCSVGGTNPRTVAVTAGAAASTAFAVTCSAGTGSIDATTATTGTELDPDGYMVAVDGGAASAIGVNDLVSFGGLSVGDHDVELTDIASNCSVGGSNPLTVAVTDGGTTTAAFDLTCVATSGDITVTTATGGASLDPNGYIVTVDGGSDTAIGINDMVTLTGFTAGNHDVELTDVEPNCTVNSANPQTITVTDGGDTPVAFGVTCSAIPPLTGKIVFDSDRDGDTEIYVMNTDGTGTVQLTTNSGIKDQDPEVNFNGTKIVFWSNRDGNNEIYTMNADGSGVTRLTNSGSSDTWPTWSPDGSTIAWSRGSSSTENIWTMNSDGTGQSALTNTAGSDVSPTFSADGSTIAFTSDRTGDAEIWTVNATTGGTLVNLTNNPGAAFRDSRPEWSPDGTKITFDRNNNLGGAGDPTWLGSAEIMVMNADGTGVLRLTTDATGIVDFQPYWSADGSKILFVTDRDGDEEIYSMNADGTGALRLTAVVGKDGAPAASP